jgi:3-hydroxyisobutyrate dehydrogenase
MRAAFIGLGVMGYPMAGHLVRRGGMAVTVYNRTAAKAEAWCAEYGGTAAGTPAAAATGADIVVLCVGDDPDVRAVTLGPGGVLETMAAGSLLIDHTTASADIARELAAACSARGIGFLDAPVSGGQAGAINGALTIMVGGEAGDHARAAPVFESYGKFAGHMGPAGAGQLAKMVNQICIAGVLQGLGEGLAFAERAGLDGRAVVQAMLRGAAQSWQMENRHATMLEGRFDFGFALDWMRKDLGIALAEARRNGASLPLTALVDQHYADLQRQGHGRWDTSSLIERLRH